MPGTALLLLDIQAGILDHFPATTTAAAYLALCAAALAAARGTAGSPDPVHVIHVRTCFRPGYPETSARNLSTSRVAARVAAAAAAAGDGAVGFTEAPAHAATVAFCREAAPRGDEPVVTKRRTSALAGSDLDAVLRGLDVQRLVVGGVATSGAVLSTVRAAADLDFGLTVLGDLCLDPDEEVHRVLVEKVFPRQARVVAVKEWIAEVEGRKGGEEKGS
jgi:nicotinamidase-related amidase